MGDTKTTEKLSIQRAMILLIVAAAVILMGKAVFKIDTTVVLLLSGSATSVFAILFGCSWSEIQAEIGESFQRIAIPIMILLAIGTMVGAWIIGGTVPTMMYYGMKILNATFFLPFTFLLSLAMALATGTSWGTISTVGVALVGISHGLGVPVGITVGAIVSGAFMGDSLSPLSDAPLLAASACDVPLMAHVRNSIKVVVPAGVITLILYTFMGLRFGGGTIEGEAYSQILDVLPKAFNLSPLTLIPVVVVVGLILMQKPTLPTLAAGTLAGVLVAMFLQGAPFVEAMKSLSAGYVGDTGSALVNGLVNRGGIKSMIGTCAIVIGATMFGAPIKASGAMTVLLANIRKVAKTPKQLMVFTWIVHPVFLLISAAYYVSYPVIGGLLSPVYDEYGVDRKNLSLILGSTGIAIAALIPWVPAGAFVISQLDVTIGQFLGYSFFGLLAPAVCLVMILTGLIGKKKAT